MNVTGVVHIDLSALVAHNGWIDTLSPGAREAWCRLSYTRPTHVRINIGEAMSINWPHHFVADLADCEHVQIVGTYPENVAEAVAQLLGALEQVKAA
jgi:hypothetical protein